MLKQLIKNKNRKARHIRVRKKVSGTPQKPRLNLYKSNTNIYAQIIDDSTGATLVAASTLEKDIKGEFENKKNVKAAAKIGTILAKRAIEKGIEEVVFDRSGYIYHGKVKALADAAREAGLKF